MSVKQRGLYQPKTATVDLIVRPPFSARRICLPIAVLKTDDVTLTRGWRNEAQLACDRLRRRCQPQLAENGRMGWQKVSGYNKRSRVEAAIGVTSR